jgi:hypothetical protein
MIWCENSLSLKVMIEHKYFLRHLLSRFPATAVVSHASIGQDRQGPSLIVEKYKIKPVSYFTSSKAAMSN